MPADIRPLQLKNISKFANIRNMNWTVSYFNERVQHEITEWPVGIYADYLRLILLMEEHGADLRLPHSRAMGDGLFELRCKGAEGIGRAFYCTMVGREIVILHSFIKKTQETPDRELKKDGPQATEGDQTWIVSNLTRFAWTLRRSLLVPCNGRDSRALGMDWKR